MNWSTTHLTLHADSVVDLQLHTVLSDGTWTPEALIDYLLDEGFGLAAITDHDRVDIAAGLQQIAHQKGFPLLVAVEMTTTWKKDLTDLLCYGFDPENNALSALTDDILRLQQENTREVYANLLKQGYRFPPTESQPDPLTAILNTPVVRQPHALLDLLRQHGYDHENRSAGRILLDAGVAFATHDPAQVVDAAHRSGAVCLIAHPGRSDGFNCLDADLLDEFCREIPVDGLEANYPTHTPEQTALYRDYARQHHLLTSSGSDSHGRDRLPIRYRADLSRDLLERLGISIHPG